jgi:hypothetical protein
MDLIDKVSNLENEIIPIRETLILFFDEFGEASTRVIFGEIANILLNNSTSFNDKLLIGSVNVYGFEENKKLEIIDCNDRYGENRFYININKMASLKVDISEYVEKVRNNDKLYFHKKWCFKKAELKEFLIKNVSAAKITKKIKEALGFLETDNTKPHGVATTKNSRKKEFISEDKDTTIENIKLKKIILELESELENIKKSSLSLPQNRKDFLYLALELRGEIINGEIGKKDWMIEKIQEKSSYLKQNKAKAIAIVDVARCLLDSSRYKYLAD